jgi:hypothetical protein
MRRPLLPFLFVAFLATPPMRAGATSATHPVVVELFTSQGCSSCPAADRLLSALASEGIGVIPLSFHVDYWNRLGWSDPFSRPEWSRRQEAYAQALGAPTLYTPQVVVDGATEMVGSDELRLRAAIARAAAGPAARLKLTLAPSATSVTVDVAIELPATFAGRPLELWVALYESGLETAVRRGENGGRTLRNDGVVRALTRAGSIVHGSPGPWRASVSIPIASTWRSQHLGVAAFVQEPRSLAIRGGASLALSAEDAAPTASERPTVERPSAYRQSRCDRGFGARASSRGRPGPATCPGSPGGAGRRRRAPRRTRA